MSSAYSDSSCFDQLIKLIQKFLDVHWRLPLLSRPTRLPRVEVRPPSVRELRQSASIMYDYGYTVTYDKIFYFNSTNTIITSTHIVIMNTHSSCRQFFNDSSWSTVTLAFILHVRHVIVLISNVWSSFIRQWRAHWRNIYF
jgi:hypothetical protein